MSLYDSESTMVVDVWTAIKPFITKKERDEAAQAFLRTLENYMSVEDMANEMSGHDGALDRALANLYDSYTENEEDYNEPEGDGNLFDDYGGYDDDDE